MSDDLMWRISNNDIPCQTFLQITRKGETYERIEFDPYPLLRHLNLRAQRIALQNGKLVIETIPAEQVIEK